MIAPLHDTESLLHTDNEKVLEIRGLCKSFGDNHVLAGFNMELFKGESLAVLGKSGSGKSVLIKCIIGLLEPDAGTIEVFGTNVPDLDHDQLDRLRARVGFLFQSNALYDSMTVKENLEFPLRRHWIQMDEDGVKTLVAEALNNVGLLHTLEMMPSELSGGMKKRVALARTLILKPDIILYDEPTTGLDPVTGREISNLIHEIGEKYACSSVIISHDMQCIRRTASRIIVLTGGISYASGTWSGLAGLEDPVVKQFFVN
ncbi:MAG TPA: ATP-binding cassette domain-containing protein [Chitinophagaceae bacterium]